MPQKDYRTNTTSKMSARRLIRLTCWPNKLTTECFNRRFFYWYCQTVNLSHCQSKSILFNKSAALLKIAFLWAPVSGIVVPKLFRQSCWPGFCGVFTSPVRFNVLEPSQIVARSRYSLAVKNVDAAGRTSTKDMVWDSKANDTRNRNQSKQTARKTAASLL